MRRSDVPPESKPSRRLPGGVQSGTALIVAVAAIFGGALLADVLGLVPRDVPAATGEEGGPAPLVTSSVDEAKLRFGIMGGFVVLCLYAILRYQGTL